MLLNKIKLLLGIAADDTDKDELLTVLLEQAQEEAVNHCHLDVYDEKLNSTVVKMVIQDYNKIGSEGLANQNNSGVSESYIDGYSSDIITALNKHRKIRFI